MSLPEGDEKVRAVREMFDTIAPRYDMVNRLMTFGLDRRWRRRAVAALRLGPGAMVLDLAAGTGDLCNDLVASGYQAVGADLSLGMLRHARTTAPLLQADALCLPVPGGAVEGAVSGFGLRNFVDTGLFFDELARVVRPGGRIAVLDVAQPPNRVLRWGHGLYFGHVVPRIGGWFSDPAAYRYLPESVAYLPTPAAMLARLRTAGFGAVTRTLLTGGIVQVIAATRIVTTAAEGTP